MTPPTTESRGGARDDDAAMEAAEGAHNNLLFSNLLAHSTRIAESTAREEAMTITPRAARALGELTAVFTSELARDLRAFAAHANRDVVHVRDVALRSRKIKPDPFREDSHEGDGSD